MRREERIIYSLSCYNTKLTATYNTVRPTLNAYGKNSYRTISFRYLNINRPEPTFRKVV